MTTAQNTKAFQKLIAAGNRAEAAHRVACTARLDQEDADHAAMGDDLWERYQQAIGLIASGDDRPCLLAIVAKAKTFMVRS